MSKSVYSIVLDDEIINQIDILSNRQGTSRSNMINRILARHVSVPTAETMVNDVFKYIDEFIQRNSSLAVQPLGSGSLINMRSALKYKYKPTIKYTVELFENGLQQVSQRNDKTVIQTPGKVVRLRAVPDADYGKHK